MKCSNPIFLSARILRLLLATLALSAIGFGCVGHKQAILMNQRLVEKSERIATLLEQEKANALAEASAHREILEQLYARLQVQQTALIQQKMSSAMEKANAEIEKVVAEQLTDWQVARHQAHAQLGEKLHASLLTWEKEAEVAKELAKKAAEQADKFPNDLDLLAASHEADRKYLAAAAEYNAVELKARIEFINKWDEAETALSQRLRTAGEHHREGLRTSFDLAVNKLSGQQIAKLDLANESASREQIYQSLINYTKAVQHAGEANLNYLESNSWGEKSFLRSAVDSFGKGVLDALPIVGSGKGASLAEVKEAGAPLLGLVQENFNDNLSQLTASSKNSVIALFNDARSRIEGNTSSALQTLLVKATDSSGKKP
jgi:hypothetical protein